ncbi:MAG: MBL fold metallo-hydrolase [Gammaproteobacteria bacterium]|nr:MBL fold metallo-hydrolase [Gammaproteobacteria bacterium]
MSQSLRSLLLAMLAVSFLAPAFAGENQAADEGIVTITAVANEGFLISDGNRAVLIDAFVRDPLPWQYHTTPAATWAAMLAGEGDFGKVIAAVASHEHVDHIQPAAAIEWLSANEGTPLFATPGAIAAIEEQGGSGLPLFDIEPWQTPKRDRSWGGLSLRFFYLPHGDNEDATPRNLGTLITIAGKRILHIGDTQPIEAFFANLDIPPGEIDLLLVPQWFLLKQHFPDALPMLERTIAPKQIALTHARTDSLQGFLQILPQIAPGVISLAEPGDTLVLD